MGVIDREYLDAKKGDKPTELDLIKLELRDLLASVGEIRLGLNAVAEKAAWSEGQINELKESLLASRMTGSIQGLEGEFTVTPPPE